MKLVYIKILYYYEVPTLIFCQDERQSNYLFALLDDETFEYIGKKVSVEEKLGVTAFLRRPSIYLLFYGYATSRRDEHPAESWMETIRQFKRRYGIRDEIEIDEAVFRTVFKMTADLINEGI